LLLYLQSFLLFLLYLLRSSHTGLLWEVAAEEASAAEELVLLHLQPILRRY